MKCPREVLAEWVKTRSVICFIYSVNVRFAHAMMINAFAVEATGSGLGCFRCWLLAIKDYNGI